MPVPAETVQKKARILFRRSANIALVVVHAFLASCGAPSKKAGEVISLFKREPDKLQEVARGLCEQLANATEAPSLKSVKLSEQDCAAVGLRTQELTTASQLDFANIDEQRLRAGESAGSPGVLYVQTRGQVWLNQPMLALAQKLIRAIKDAQANGTSALLPNMNASAAESEVVKLDFREIQKTTLDETGKRLSAVVELNGRGAAQIHNVIVTEGRIFNDSIALEINTREDRAFEDSILQRLNAVVLIIPYGNDVYVDMVIDLRIHSLGIDRLMSDQISNALGTGVKAGLDALAKLE
jgi:hypothetical protein